MFITYADISKIPLNITCIPNQFTNSENRIFTNISRLFIINQYKNTLIPLSVSLYLYNLNGITLVLLDIIKYPKTISSIISKNNILLFWILNPE